MEDPPPLERMEELLPDERMEELLPDERMELLLDERMEELDGATERVCVGTLDALFTVEVVRDGAVVAVFDRRELDDTALLRDGVLLVRVVTDCARLAVPRDVVAVARLVVAEARLVAALVIRSLVRTFELPKVRELVPRVETRVVDALPLAVARVALLPR